MKSLSRMNLIFTYSSGSHTYIHICMCDCIYVCDIYTQIYVCMYTCIYRCIYACMPGAVNLSFKGQYYECIELLVSFSIYYSSQF